MRIPRKRRTKVVQIIFLISIIVYGILKIGILGLDKKIQEQQDLLNQQNQQLSEALTITGYQKLDSIRYLKKLNKNQSRKDQLTQLFDIFQQLKSLDQEEGNYIKFEDFKISPEKITIKGSVSRLRLLYHKIPGKDIGAILEKFKELDFLKNIQIRTYEKEAGAYKFILNAEIKNGTK